MVGMVVLNERSIALVFQWVLSASQKKKELLFSMKSYQLYKKSGVSVALDIEEASFTAEKFQLLGQGFKKTRDVKATSKKEALNKLSVGYLFYVCIIEVVLAGPLF